MRTGDVVERPGVYQCACCRINVAVQIGETLPVCPACGHDCSWSMIRAEVQSPVHKH